MEQVGITEKCKWREKENGRELGKMFVSIKTIKYKKISKNKNKNGKSFCCNFITLSKSV